MVGTMESRCICFDICIKNMFKFNQVEPCVIYTYVLNINHILNLTQFPFCTLESLSAAKETFSTVTR